MNEAQRYAIAEGHGERLQTHYRQQKNVINAFKEALNQVQQSNPELHEAFRQHLLNAQIISGVEVRAYDIAAWMMPALPENLQKALSAVQESLHLEASLRRKLAQVEWREPGSEIDEWSREQETEARKYGLAYKNHGYEDTHSQGGYQHFALRFEDNGPYLIRYLLAGLQAREVLLQHAKIEERHGALEWVNGACKDRKILNWIQSAEWYLRNPSSKGYGNGGSADPAPNFQKLAKFFKLTSPTHHLILEKLLNSLAYHRSWLEKRREMTQHLMDMRGMLKTTEEKIADITNGNSNEDLGMAQLQAGGFSFAVMQAEQAMEESFGDRERWDWEAKATSGQ